VKRSDSILGEKVLEKNGRILMTTLGECTEPEEVLRKAYKYL